MMCVICKHGELRAGKATVTLERDGMTLVFKGVPARVCQTCDEQYVDEATTTKLLEAVDEAAKTGVQVDIREYLAA